MGISAEDLDDAETFIDVDELVAAADSVDPTDPAWLDRQWYAADALHDRYRDDGDPTDLDEAICRARTVVDAATEPDPLHLHVLGMMLIDRWGLTPSEGDRQDCIEILEQVLTYPSKDELDDELIAASHALLAYVLSTDSLGARSVDDIRRAVRHGELAVAGVGEPEDRAEREQALTAALLRLHDADGGTKHLRRAIHHQRRVIDLLGPGHPDTPGISTDLLLLLVRLTQETNDESSLSEALYLGQALAEGIPMGHSDRLLLLTASATALTEAARRRSDITLFVQALDLYREGAQAAEPNTPAHAAGLVDVARTCYDIHERLDHEKYLKEGLAAGRRALHILGKRDPGSISALSAVANLLHARFRMRRRRKDLIQAIKLTTRALHLTPDDDPRGAAYLTNLGIMTSDAYDEFADRAQLDLAIGYYRDALTIRDPMSMRLPERQHNLSMALLARYKDSGGSDHLEEALEWAESAVAVTEPQWATWPIHANNLGNLLMEHYELWGDRHHLDRAIDIYTAVVSCPHQTEQEASSYATNLGIALEARGVADQNLGDVSQALLYLEQSAALLPVGHPERAARVSNYADALRRRSVMQWENGSITEALGDALHAEQRCREAVDAAGTSDARLLPALANLAELLRWRNVVTPGAVPDKDILDTQRQAALLTRIAHAERFRQAARWAEDAERYKDAAQAMAAYTLAVGLTTDVAWIGLDTRERLDLLRQMNDTLQRAVGLAISVGQPWTAVAWADHMRSVIWRQDLAVSALSRRQGDPGLLILSSTLSRPADSTNTEHRNHREHVRQLAHARGTDLLTPAPSAEDYASLSIDGTIIILTVGEEASAALLLQDGDEPLIVALPRAAQGQLEEQVASLVSAVDTLGSDTVDPASKQIAHHLFFDCLDWLWDAVVEPILLEISDDSDERPRLWWSPLGPFAQLPIHAAGHHPRTSPQVSTPPTWAIALQDRALSSYLPTVLRQQPDMPPAPDRPDELLYVSVDSDTDPLSGLEPEFQAARQALRNIPITSLTDQDATIQALREAIPRCRFLHIAGHGGRPEAGSAHVGFQVADGVFTLGDLAATRTNGDLAVIFTCDSARGDSDVPNESLHIAAAAHNAGFPHVIATTMSVRDSSAATVTQAIYTALDASPDTIAEAIPQALDDAVRSLRCDPSTGTDPLAWVPYAHYALAKSLSPPINQQRLTAHG